MYKDRTPAWAVESKPHHVTPRTRHFTLMRDRIQTKISSKDGYTYKIRKNIKHKSDCYLVPQSALEISLVGYNRLKDPEYSKIWKCIWIFILLSCIVTLAYWVKIRVSYMNSRSLVSNVMFVTDANISFPSMTLCPSHFYIFQYTMGGGYSQQEVEFRNVIYEKMFKNVSDINQIFKDIAISEDAISAYIPCEENDEDCEMKTGKNLQVTMRKIHTYWGYCIAISTDVQLLFRGPFSYLRIMVNVSKLDFSLIDKVKRLLDSMGVKENPLAKRKILYHIYPAGFEGDKHEIFYYGMMAEAKTRLDLQLSYTKFMFHNSSTRVCLKPEEVAQCRNKFIDKILEDNLPCSPSYIDFTHNKLCDNMNNSFEGSRQAFLIYSTLNMASFTCPEACNTTSYSITKLIEDNYSDDTVEFKIFYLEESYELTKEQMAHTLFDYVSDIGGMFGFFLGFCLLSILELMDFLIHWIWKKSKDCKESQT